MDDSRTSSFRCVFGCGVILLPCKINKRIDKRKKRKKKRRDSRETKETKETEEKKETGGETYNRIEVSVFSVSSLSQGRTFPTTSSLDGRAEVIHYPCLIIQLENWRREKGRRGYREWEAGRGCNTSPKNHIKSNQDHREDDETYAVGCLSGGWYQEEALYDWKTPGI